MTVDELTADAFVGVPLALLDVAGTEAFRELKTWPGEIWEECAWSTADAQLATETKRSSTSAITSFWREVTGKSFVYVFVGLSRCKEVMSLDERMRITTTTPEFEQKQPASLAAELLHSIQH